MKLDIMHLLHYRWKGPSIGVRIKIYRWRYGVIIPIPQWFSSLLIRLQNLYKVKSICYVN